MPTNTKNVRLSKKTGSERQVTKSDAIEPFSDIEAATKAVAPGYETDFPLSHPQLERNCFPTGAIHRAGVGIRQLSAVGAFDTVNRKRGIQSRQ